MWWLQKQVEVPATIPDVHNYLVEARQRNVCLIRGLSTDPTRVETRRWKADGMHNGCPRDHGFIDVPTKFFPLDIDGFQIAVAGRSRASGACRRGRAGRAVGIDELRLVLFCNAWIGA